MTQLLQAFIRDYQDDAYPSEMLERFELLECLAQTEQGETLLARDLTTGDKAIIKCYPRESDADAQEALVLSRLSAPGLPRLLAQYTSPTLHCVARTYAQGRPLSDPGLREPLSREDILSIGMQLCQLLTSLHQQDPPIIHRDVKPQNVILGDDGAVSLIDFGISRAYKPSAQSDTVFFGTQRFASPEQYGFRQTDCRSDIYSLGGVMLFLCTGDVQPERIREQIDDKHLADVIARCMAFAPEDRYPTAEEARAALNALTPAGKRKRRVRASHLAALGVALLCAVGLFVGGWLVPTLSAPASYAFEEPLIERAVRMSLGLSEDEPIDEEKLATVQSLYLMADACYANVDDYYQAVSRWYQSDRALGPVASLADLEHMPALRDVCMGAQRITDISALAHTPDLERVELRGNRVSDVEPLADHAILFNVGLNDNPVRDLTPLASCPCLKILDLCDASSYDPAFLEAFDAFEFLDISNQTASYKQLAGKAIRDLRLNYTPIDTLDWLSGVSGLQTLEIQGTAIKSLDGLKAHQGLISLRLSKTRIDDYAPLLDLPDLKTVTVARAEAASIQPIAAQGGFEVILE